MELRKLKSSDMFTMLNIINKIGVKEFKTCFESEAIQRSLSNKDVIYESIGLMVAFEIVGVILPNLIKCKEDIYQFLSDLSNTDVKILENMDFVEFTNVIVDFVKKDEFKDFFKVVSKLVK